MHHIVQMSYEDNKASIDSTFPLGVQQLLLDALSSNDINVVLSKLQGLRSACTFPQQGVIDELSAGIQLSMQTPTSGAYFDPSAPQFANAFPIAPPPVVPTSGAYFDPSAPQFASAFPIAPPPVVPLPPIAGRFQLPPPGRFSLGLPPTGAILKRRGATAGVPGFSGRQLRASPAQYPAEAAFAFVPPPSAPLFPGASAPSAPFTLTLPAFDPYGLGKRYLAPGDGVEDASKRYRRDVP